MMFGNSHPPFVCQGAAKEVDLVTPHPVNMNPMGNGETLGKKPREMPRKSVEPRSFKPGVRGTFLGYLGSLFNDGILISMGLCFIIPI